MRTWRNPTSSVSERLAELARPSLKQFSLCRSMRVRIASRQESVSSQTSSKEEPHSAKEFACGSSLSMI